MVTYETGTPTERGVYACRIDHPDMPGVLKDIFLMFIESRWGYLGSDQPFRGAVHGWIGPLQRRMTPTEG